MKASIESAMELADQLNPKKKGDSEGGLYSNKSYDQITEREDDNDQVAKKNQKRKRKEMTFADKKEESEDE
jgi:hypothetical protein